MAVEICDLRTGRVEIDAVANKLAPKFNATFNALLSVMEIQKPKDREQRANKLGPFASLSSSGSTNTADKTLEQSAKRVFYPTPEPSATGDALYTDSSESEDEEPWATELYSQKLLSQLMMDTLGAIGAEFRKIQWQRSGHRVELSQ